MLTGSAAAVAGLPRYRHPGRFEVESCCTLRLNPNAQVRRLQGIDSTAHVIAGPGYTLSIVFGPYDGAPPQSGYSLAGRTSIDGVQVTTFRWTDRNSKPPEGGQLWLAHVGGGRIDGVNHAPWGLRIAGECDAPTACRSTATVAGTIRF